MREGVGKICEDGRMNEERDEQSWDKIRGDWLEGESEWIRLAVLGARALRLPPTRMIHRSYSMTSRI